MTVFVHFRKGLGAVRSFTIFFQFCGLRARSRRGKDLRDQKPRRTLVSVLHGKNNEQVER